MCNKNNKTLAERRQYKRVRARFIVTYKVNEPLETALIINRRQISAIMLDLSEAGMALVTGIDIPAHSAMLMNFTLINTAALNEEEKLRTMDITGQVCYALRFSKNEYRLGIRFTHINADDKAAITSFVCLALNNYSE